MPDRTGTYDANFGQHLIDHGAPPPTPPDNSHVTQPQNWDEISMMLEQPRLPLISTGLYDVQYRAFRMAKDDA